MFSEKSAINQHLIYLDSGMEIEIKSLQSDILIKNN